MLLRYVWRIERSTDPNYFFGGGGQGIGVSITIPLRNPGNKPRTKIICTSILILNLGIDLEKRLRKYQLYGALRNTLCLGGAIRSRYRRNDSANDSGEYLTYL